MLILFLWDSGCSSLNVTKVSNNEVCVGTRNPFEPAQAFQQGTFSF